MLNQAQAAVLRLRDLLVMYNKKARFISYLSIHIFYLSTKLYHAMSDGIKS